MPPLHAPPSLPIRGYALRLRAALPAVLPRVLPRVLRTALLRTALLRTALLRTAVLSTVLLTVLLLAAQPVPAQAPRRPSPLKEEATLPLPAAAGAVAINADESILAAATADGRGRWRVNLFDRPSRAPLGAISAAVGKEPRLAFSPAADLLLVAGSEALQLWALPIAPLDPEQVLSEDFRRWELRPAQAPAAAAFGTPPDAVYWSVGADLFRRSAQAGTAFDGKPVWQPKSDAHPIEALAFDPDSAQVALVYQQRKEIGLLDLNNPRLPRSLAGHRFPAIAARFAPGRPLLTLDAGNTLLQWRDNRQAVATTFLEQLPKGFKVAAFEALGDRHLLLLGEDGRALAVEARTARPVAELKADGPQRIAVSPTGRYVIAAEGRTLHVYGFAAPLAPLDYVRRLRNLQAFDLAQSYVRLMDDTGMPPQLKADLLNEASREPPGRELQNALERLAQSEQEGDADRIRYWAEQVLSLQAEHPDAVAALRRLREQQDAQALQQAREALNLGQSRVAISLLAGQVQQDSRYYAEAVQVIREAEAKRSVETTLVQAREKLSMGDTVGAEALVNTVLRKDSGNPAAQALLDEIGGRSGATWRRLLSAVIGLGLAALLVGFIAARYRRRLGPLARKLRLDEDVPPAGPLGRAARTGAAAEPKGAAEPPPPKAERAPQRAQMAGAARRKVVEHVVHETEERLHALRRADVQGRHRARLMELEAELAAIARRCADPSAELGPLHTRLKEIQAQVRGIRIEPERPRAQAGPQTGAGGAKPGGPQAAGGPGDAPAKDKAAAAEARSHYEVLELSPEATPEQIKTAYHRLLKQYHPDLHNASEFPWVRAEAERMSRRISEAYQVLGDSGARARYDRDLRARRRPAP